ncbi:SMF family protein (plasmid) [Pseudonocardia dioxanivorans CB1190]|uniref:SMF family protein n=1 Tax=Pseudonocardia dioxanivorans (strain ATCC 55486 / DSM 44775 / JCM 13855 / CB1190) TaxID=675635 RepID=F2L6L9_PSEUX|nr:DNA-processing protein DprA [Pseudonocardia dioxanivorans]AEA28913.1 SMF family protein [Pseudonocardia dioxanivorans CB1190]
MFPHTRPSIPAPTPGPDPLAEHRVARAFLLRLADQPSGRPALEQFILSAGALAAAEQLHRGDVPESLTAHVSTARVQAAAAGAAVDGETAARCGARLLIPEDAQWPGTAALTGTVGLWVRGHAGLEILSGASITLAGSRAASGYGTHVAADLAGDLARGGHTVVAGGGFGIEAAASRGALAAHAPTVAVLGCGIDRAYPAAHENLLDRIAHTGLLVSAQPPGSTPSRLRALARNRVLATLGDATVVVEAAARSGALHVAAAAHECGRPVMAVPGPVTSAISMGAHQLIRQGATLVTSGADVLDALERAAGTSAVSGSSQTPDTP